MARTATLALVLAATVGCERRADSTTEGAPTAPGSAIRGAAVEGPPPLPADAVRISGKNFQIDAAPAGSCHTGARCEVRLHLTALGGFKVNQDYPFKLVTEPTPGIEHDGTGSFQAYGPTLGVLTVRFRPAAAGTATVRGTFKLSVCDAEVCQIEATPIALDVPVT